MQHHHILRLEAVGQTDIVYRMLQLSPYQLLRHADLLVCTLYYRHGGRSVTQYVTHDLLPLCSRTPIFTSCPSSTSCSLPEPLSTVKGTSPVISRATSAARPSTSTTTPIP